MIAAYTRLPGLTKMSARFEQFSQLAVEALGEAEARGRDPGGINQARRALAEGDGLREAGRFKDAVSKYKDALAKAESARR